MKSYNNNERQVTNTTFSSMSFSNSESKISHSKFNISYFNRVLKVGIALESKDQANSSYVVYDNDNQTAVFISWGKAKILSDLIKKMKSDASIHNVCIELNGGLFMVSDGSDYGTTNPCFSITRGDDNGVTTVIYETKNSYSGAYNYKDTQNYETYNAQNLELEAFETVLEEFYRTATYAVAASVMEANMYKRDYTNNLLQSIGEKVGARTSNNNNGGGNYNSRSFLGGGNNNSSQSNTTSNNDNGFSQSSFEDIANSML